MTKEQLKALLADDMDAVVEKVVEAMNRARPGRIIDDSEELVREAAGEFRRRPFEKALKLRGQSEAFSPSADRETPGDAPAQ
jgi:hypothetical protein